MSDVIATVIGTRIIELAQTGLVFYAIKRGFDYLTARLHWHGSEPIVLERTKEEAS